MEVFLDQRMPKEGRNHQVSSKGLAIFANIYQINAAQSGFSLGSIAAGDKGKDAIGMSPYRMGTVADSEDY